MRNLSKTMRNAVGKSCTAGHTPGNPRPISPAPEPWLIQWYLTVMFGPIAGPLADQVLSHWTVDKPFYLLLRCLSPLPRSSLNQTLRRFIGTKISWHQCTCRVIRVDTAIIFWSRSVIIFHDSIWWCASVSGMPSITVRPSAFLRLRTLVGCCTRCLSFGFCSWISLVVGASGRCTARSRGPRRD